MKQRIYNTALYLRISRDDELQGESGTAGRRKGLEKNPESW